MRSRSDVFVRFWIDLELKILVSKGRGASAYREKNLSELERSCNLVQNGGTGTALTTYSATLGTQTSRSGQRWGRGKGRRWEFSLGGKRKKQGEITQRYAKYFIIEKGLKGGSQGKRSERFGHPVPPLPRPSNRLMLVVINV